MKSAPRRGILAPPDNLTAPLKPDPFFYHDEWHGCTHRKRGRTELHKLFLWAWSVRDNRDMISRTAYS
jgi:hypothetical protein